MSLVDFVVEEEDRLLLVEVKDPGDAAAGYRNRAIADFQRSMRQKDLIHGSLVPKARDSYTWLHLMQRDGEPMIYVVVLGLERLDPALLLNFKDRLLRRLRKEAEEPWKRRYVEDCIVLTLEGWRRVLGRRYPLGVRAGGP